MTHHEEPTVDKQEVSSVTAEGQEEEEEVLPTYNDAVDEDGSKVPLLQDEKTEEAPVASEVTEMEPPKYQRQEGVEEAELTSEYSTGLFGCKGNVSSFLKGVFLPCVAFAQTDAILSSQAVNRDRIENAFATDGTYDVELAQYKYAEPSNLVTCCQASAYTFLAANAPAGTMNCLGWMQRQRIRYEHGLEPHMFKDCMAHLCCHPCALAQDLREVKARDEQRRVEFNRVQQQFADML